MPVTETITRAEAGSSQIAKRYRLSVVYPRVLAGRVVELGSSSVVVGRKVTQPDGIRLEHPTVSRKHLAIHWDPGAGRHFAVELGSRNGSTLNGTAVHSTPRLLEDNAVLRLGDVFAVYEVGTGAWPDDPAVDRDAIVGDSFAMQEVRGRVGRMAADPSPVLIIGESGAGKERIAGELHRLSKRKGACITLNCAALSATLIESQLFGHVRGAFTGAKQASEGFFAAADGGTLFLDEIGELPLDLQPKLLRAIESGEVTAVGSTRSRIVDVRIVAATNRDLPQEVEQGRFRRDLLARLSLWLLEVPPIRRRRADILGWLDRLAKQWSRQRERELETIELSAPAVATIIHAAWPDNLRGLNRLVHELAHLDASPVAREVLPPWLLMGEGAAQGAESAMPQPVAKPNAKHRTRPSREEFVAVLERVGYSVRAAARELGRDRKQIKRWIAMYDVKMP